MTNAEMQAEALTRATANGSVSNYPAIFRGMMEKGIPEDQILPRVNIFTYNAWKALGRQVMKSERGVRVTTWVKRPERRNDAGEVTRKGANFPRHTTVFHVSQTEAV